VQRIAWVGVLAWFKARKVITFVTITAGGDDPTHERLSVKVDGSWLPREKLRCGCEHPVLVNGIGRWNHTAGGRWNHARTRLVREHGLKSFVRFVEVQDGKHRDDGLGRGALHYHLFMVWEQAPDWVAVQRLLIECGFGCSLDVKTMTDRDAVAKYAKYASKYAVKSITRRGKAPWVDEHGVIGEPTYRTWSASQNWPASMRGMVEESRRAVEARDAARAGRGAGGGGLAGLVELEMVVPGIGGVLDRCGNAPAAFATDDACPVGGGVVD
jgi:hypothetical protein